VFAIGIAFYLSKQPKPPPAPVVMRGGGYMGAAGSGWNHTQKRYMSSLNEHLCSGGGAQSAMNPADIMSQGMTSPKTPSGEVPTSGGGIEFGASAGDVLDYAAPPEVETKSVEVGAGAKIHQQLCFPDDSNPAEFYQEKPAALIYANYCLPDDFKRIMEAGAADRTKGGEGFLSGLNKGNP
jgi:hypothetical protein